MPNHFACIGFGVSDGASFETLAQQTLARGDGHERSGGRTVRFRDASGATLVYQLDGEGEVQCVTPCFESTARIQARAKRWVEDGDCRFCDRLIVDVLDTDDPRDAGDDSKLFCYPLPVQLDDVVAARERIAEGQRLELAVSLFAEELSVYRSEDAFRDATLEDEIRFAAESFVPSGLFTDDEDAPPTAHGRLGGRVLSAKLRENATTGCLYWWARVRSFGGVFELLAPAEDVESLESDAVVQGSCWVVARIL